MWCSRISRRKEGVVTCVKTMATEDKPGGFCITVTASGDRTSTGLVRSKSQVSAVGF